MDPSKTFISDGEENLSYAALLDRVSKADSYFPAYKTTRLADYAANFFTALAHGKDLTLVDADMSGDELARLGASNINAPQPVSGASFKTFEALRDAVEASPSHIVIFTSGTAGLPKKVSHTVATLARAVRTSPEYASHIWGFCYNPTHMAGLQVLFQVFFNGNTAIDLFRKPKADIFRAIDTCGITHLSATPTFYRLLLPEPTRHPSVLRVTCGGEKSGTALYEALALTFPNAKINNIYATTEFGTLLASSGEFFKIPEHLKDRVKINEGELLVHKSLIGASDTLQLDGEYYRSGDLVEWADGDHILFKFLSRKSNLLNTGGYKVNLEEVEDCLRLMPQVADVVAYSRANSVLGSVLCADIKLKDGTALDLLEVRTFLNTRLQSFKIPRKIQFVQTIESTRTGKIKRS